jgi:hypothetical protein
MLKKVLIVLSTLVVIVAVLVAFLGYKFSQSGDDYGEQRQLAAPDTLRKTAYGDVVGFLDISESHTWMGIPFATTCAGEHLLNLLPGRGHSTLSKLPTVVSRLVLLARAGHGKNTANRSDQKTVCI